MWRSPALWRPEPKILFADEPTGNLDGTTGESIVEMMFALQKRFGATLVLITHDLALARRCDRVAGIEDGRMTAESPVMAAT